MSDQKHISEVNLYKVYRDLDKAMVQLKAGAADASVAALTEAFEDFRGQGIAFDPEDGLQGLVPSIIETVAQIREGEMVEAQETLSNALLGVGGRLPMFRIVLIDETQNWQSKELVDAAGTIYGSYLYDERRHVHLAELQPSYEMHYLGAFTKNGLSDEMDEFLREGANASDDSIYMHCRTVDAISWDRKRIGGEPSDPGADSYDALVEGETEYYTGNVVMDSPSRTDEWDFVKEALRQLKVGDYETAGSLLEESMLHSDRVGFVAAIQDVYDKTLSKASFAPEKSIDLLAGLRREDFPRSAAQPEGNKALDAAISEPARVVADSSPSP